MTCLARDWSDPLAVAAACTGTTPEQARSLMVMGALAVLPLLVMVAVGLTLYLATRR